MADAISLAEFGASTQSGQFYLIYQALGGTDVNLACFDASTQSGQLYLIYQAILNGGGGGSGPTIVGAPSSLTDFSTLPGGVLPTSGNYEALDSNFIYTLQGGVDTTWQETPRNN